MYTYDKATQSFDPKDLTVFEVETLKQVAQDIVLRGEQSHVNNEPFRIWCEAAGHDDRQRLLMYGVVFPQRIMLCIIDWLEEVLDNS